MISATEIHNEDTLPARTADLRRLSLTVGVVGLGAWLVLALIPWSRSAALPAYLVAYVFVLGISVGSLGFLMLHLLVGGKWGFLLRRPLEAATTPLLLLLMAALFLPLAVGSEALYAWADPSAVKESLILQNKAGYLNLPFWLGRSALYFVIWTGLAALYRRGSIAQDANADPRPTERAIGFAGPALVVTFLSVTFAAIDWMMSIEPEWYSTIYGVMVMIGWALSALAVGIIVASKLADVRPFSEVADQGGFHDLGNLLLAFTMLWAYMSFSQYLIIWMGDLSEEIPWYLKRSSGGWRWVCAALMIFHFFVPFFCLLIRENKRESTRLQLVAAALLVMHVVNDAWLIIPAFAAQRLQLVALVPALAGVGGIWVALFLRGLTSRTLLPRHDPMLAEALVHHGGGH